MRIIEIISFFVFILILPMHRAQRHMPTDTKAGIELERKR